MTDVFSEEKRRQIMRSIRGSDTKPEMAVRKLVHGLGYRYRLHVSSLPGKPDMVFAGRRKIIFVHGCFWHRHRCRRGRSTPATRRVFWQKKLMANKNRDSKQRRQLRRLGWRVLVVWQCQTVPRKAVWLVDRLVNFLGDD